MVDLLQQRPLDEAAVLGQLDRIDHTSYVLLMLAKPFSSGMFIDTVRALVKG